MSDSIKDLVVVSVLRWVLTALLLGTVWFHAHWSVALSLTLSAFALEVMGWTRRG